MISQKSPNTNNAALDNTVKLWDLEAENPEVSMRTLQHQAAVYSVAVSMDCKLMVTGCDGRFPHKHV